MNFLTSFRAPRGAWIQARAAPSEGAPKWASARPPAIVITAFGRARQEELAVSRFIARYRLEPGTQGGAPHLDPIDILVQAIDRLTELPNDGFARRLVGHSRSPAGIDPSKTPLPET